MKIVTNAIPGLAICSNGNIAFLIDIIDRLMRSLFTGRYILDRMVNDHEIELGDAEDGMDKLIDACKQYELERNDEACLDFETYIEDKLQLAFPLLKEFCVSYNLSGALSIEAHSEEEAKEKFVNFSFRELRENLIKDLGSEIVDIVEE